MGHFQDSNRVDFHRARVLIGGLRIDHPQGFDQISAQRSICTTLPDVTEVCFQPDRNTTLDGGDIGLTGSPR